MSEQHPPVWIEWFMDQRNWDRPHLLHLPEDGFVRLSHSQAVQTAEALGMPVVDRTVVTKASRAAESWIAFRESDIVPFIKVMGLPVDDLSASRAKVRFWSEGEVVLSVPFEREVTLTLDPESRIRW